MFPFMKAFIRLSNSFFQPYIKLC